MLVHQPFLIKTENGSHLKISKSIFEPDYTQTCRQTSAFVVPPFLVDNKQNDCEPSRIRCATEATNTLHCDPRLHLVTPPLLTEMYSGGQVREISDVINTATAGGIKTGLITTESWNSFIDYYYTKPQPSLTQHALNTQPAREMMAITNYREPVIEDCFYRMFKDYEVQAAMAFERNYVVLGTSKEKVKQLGNAVTPPSMEYLVDRCIESLS